MSKCAIIRKKKSEITREDAIKVLAYDKETGILTRKVRSAKCVQVGDIAGTVNLSGYVQVNLMGNLVLAHRVIWLMVYGEWPKNQIDHIDGNRTNNALCNLRCVSSLENGRNKVLQKGSKSGFTGVTWDSENQCWRVKIGVHRKTIHIGRFKDLEAAIAARKRANIKYGFHENHGKVKPIGEQT